jgi:hypothetical protein
VGSEPLAQPFHKFLLLQAHLITSNTVFNRQFSLNTKCKVILLLPGVFYGIYDVLADRVLEAGRVNDHL